MKLALLAGVAVIGSVGLAGSASAQTATQVIYSGGGTLASKVYRQLFDCWGVQANASFPIATACVDPATGATSLAGDTSGLTVQILYAPVGSGAGKKAFATHNAVNLGTPSASNTVPYVSGDFPGYPYPDFHFAGSDDVITQNDVNLYSRNNGPANYGAILQIPAFSTTVTIPFNGNDGNGNALNINPANTAHVTSPCGFAFYCNFPSIYVGSGGSSGLNLSRQALCGIFTGHITQWNNPVLTALNGGTVLGTGPITVVHRWDGSGTTFLITNALKAQCAVCSVPTTRPTRRPRCMSSTTPIAGSPPHSAMRRFRLRVPTASTGRIW
jgi:PBP superfamily domain